MIVILLVLLSVLLRRLRILLLLLLLVLLLLRWKMLLLLIRLLLVLGLLLRWEIWLLLLIIPLFFHRKHSTFTVLSVAFALSACAFALALAPKFGMGCRTFAAVVANTLAVSASIGRG